MSSSKGKLAHSSAVAQSQGSNNPLSGASPDREIVGGPIVS